VLSEYNYYSRLGEYENFQKTNLEHRPDCYADWMFCRTIKEENERNLPNIQKIINYFSNILDKFLIKIFGNKEKAREFKILLALGYVFLDETRKHFLKNNVICGLAIAVILVCCAICIQYI
jgi:hypothetical protein